MEHERHEYKGHLIELRLSGADELRVPSIEGKVNPELFIDNTPINYGQLPDGSYFLNDYAYDWQGNLIELSKRFIDYKSSIDEIRHEHKSEEK